MPKDWGKQIFTHGRFPEVGQKQKTEKKREERKRPKVGDNNGQAMHGARKHSWRTQAAWAKKLKFDTRKLKFRSGSLEGEMSLAWSYLAVDRFGAGMLGTRSPWF